MTGRPGRARWSLRTRLVVTAVTLIAVVCAVIGTVTTVALSSSLGARLDDELTASLQRSLGPADGPGRDPGHHGPPAGHPGHDVRDVRNVRFAAMPGQPIGTVGARTDDHGRLTAAARSTEKTGKASGPDVDPAERLRGLTAAQTRALDRVPTDRAPHTVSLPGLGDYRVRAARVHGGEGSLIVGLPMGDTQSTLGTLIVVEVCVAGAGLVAAGIAGTILVRVALRPLRRVATTATRVAGLRLHRGEVTLPHRVPEADTDPRTEVGQVGAALNSMLGHVGSALEARQESETRVRRFVADASHELRTPLASIRGYAELTRRPSGGTDEAETRHALARIESEAARMTGLVEDLLLLARLDAGRPLERAEVDLSSLVVDAVGDARAAGPDHVWRLELPAEPVHVRGDRARLQQTLVNLLANARTHTPEGTTVTARVRAPEGAPGGSEDEVTVEVEDLGPGIPSETLPHIFERFARGDAGRSRTHADNGGDGDSGSGDRSDSDGSTGSTGLGLAIVQAVATAHGGQVSVDSEPGRTTFAVRLPEGGSGEAPIGTDPSAPDTQQVDRLST